MVTAGNLAPHDENPNTIKLMPLNGNRLGPRKKYVYESDDVGRLYILTTDPDLAIPGTGVGAGSPTEYDPNGPQPGGTIGPAPKRFKPRRVHMTDAATGAQKSIVVFNPSGGLYSASASSQVTIDGLSFRTTGRTGERLSY